MVLSFYKNAVMLDELKQKTKPSIRDIVQLDRLIRKRIYERYFFHDLTNLNWFDILIDMDVFKSYSIPRRKREGKNIFFPPWWPGLYLEKIADKIPDKILNVITKIETNNIVVHAHCAKAIINMPVKFIQEKSREVISLFDKWLDSDYPSYVHDLVVDLLKKYTDSNSYDEACQLVDILSKTTKKGKRDISFRIKSYYYDEIVEKHFPKLVQNRPFIILGIIEKRFKETLDYNNGSSKNMSVIWRPTIEDTNQTWGHGVYDLLFVILRDTMQKVAEIDSLKTIGIVKRYLNDKYSIFRRLAIHIIRVSEFDDLAVSILIDRNNLYESEIFHEYVLLMREKFLVLDPTQKNQLIDWILEGPVRDNLKDDPKYEHHWKTRWLLNLKKHFESDLDIAEKRYLLDEYKSNFIRVEHPDLLSYTTTFTGPRSPLTDEQLKKMTAEDFIKWAKTEFKPPYEPTIGSPEGVSRILEEFIRKNPDKYLTYIDNFLDEELWPAYLSGLIRGLENAIKDGKVFNLEPVLAFIEDPLKFHSEPEANYDYFEVGKYTWLRRTIASFMATLVRKEEFPLSEDMMNRMQDVLVELIENDEDPSFESEKTYGPEVKNMDYVMYCMNSNRGQAMIALMHHASRRARMRPIEEIEEEKGKGPFPAGERMDLYKQFFTKRLDLEPSPSVQSSYGQFLPYLFYLDQKWVEQMKQQNKLFPESEEKNKFWEAHWQGYIGFNDFYDPIFELLKEEYKQVINNFSINENKEKHYSHYDERLVRHLVIAFWRKLDDIQNSGSILKTFFEVAPMELRERAISFMAEGLKEVELSKESEDWKRARALWGYRVKEANDEELANFTRWLEYCPEDLDDIAHLIEPIIPYLHIGYHGQELLKYINKQIEVKLEEVSPSLQLVNELLKIKKPDRPMYLRDDIRQLIREILIKARKYKDNPEIAKGINQAVNRLGEIGYYELRDLLVE